MTAFRAVAKVTVPDKLHSSARPTLLLVSSSETLTLVMQRDLITQLWCNSHLFLWLNKKKNSIPWSCPPNCLNKSQTWPRRVPVLLHSNCFHSRANMSLMVGGSNDNNGSNLGSDSLLRVHVWMVWPHSLQPRPAPSGSWQSCKRALSWPDCRQSKSNPGAYQSAAVRAPSLHHWEVHIHSGRETKSKVSGTMLLSGTKPKWSRLGKTP